MKQFIPTRDLWTQSETGCQTFCMFHNLLLKLQKVWTKPVRDIHGIHQGGGNNLLNVLSFQIPRMLQLVEEEDGRW